METQYHDYQYRHYGLDVASRTATEFYPLEKAAKITYRMLDLAAIFFKNFPSPFATVSSNFKDFILIIEGTRFPCVSFPVFFPRNGTSFFKSRTYVQCAEKVSIISHLALKTLFLLERVDLMHLGIVAAHTIGNLSIFKWAVESTVFMFNFFGSWDGTVRAVEAQRNIGVAQKKIEKWGSRQGEAASNKQRKWEVIKGNLEIDRNRGIFKFAAKISKLILIVLATSFAVMNIWTVPCQVSVLSLGVASDAVGMVEHFYQHYRKPIKI